MGKTVLQKPGSRKVCKNCGSLDSRQVGSEMICTVCGKKDFTEMGFVEHKQFVREIAETQKMKKFSFYHCDELHAAVFLFIAILILIFWIFIIHSKWGIW